MKIISAVTLLLLIFGISEAKNGCPRCTKIESERAKEQAAHPQQLQYFDDYIKTHPNFQNEGTVALTDKSEDEAYSNWLKKVESEKLSNPGMSEENKEIEKAQQKKQELQSENKTMIDTDQKMFNQGYDPNEGYSGFKNPDLNKKYTDQENRLRGQ